ncbi:hypothetical protein FRC12_024973 [Ceratobasidium sp. 428]|nr:hypothetical protein FRC12_024973 [Ceratobasidium sp. 428]
MDASRSGNRWAIGLAPRALKELQKFKRDKNSLDIVWKKIKELSAGQFTPDNHTAVIGTMPKIPVYRARMSNDLRIIYHVDVVSDKAQEFDHQGKSSSSSRFRIISPTVTVQKVIKILRIEARAHVDYGFWTRVSSHLYRRYQPGEYRERCMFRLPKTSSENNEYLPSKFPHAMHVSDAFPTGDEIDNEEDEVIIALGSEGYVPVTKSLFDSLAGGKDIGGETEEQEVEPKSPVKTFHPMGRITLPPDPDPYQHSIVDHRGASIVVGRSGTGKTTALIYKMQSIDQSADASFRQLFVTRSRVLAKHVESSFSRLVDSINMESEAAEELGETSKELDQALVEFDNEIDLRNDLPSCFSDLDDTHFPLFISFEKLCSLIEADMRRERDLHLPRLAWSAKPLWEYNHIDYREFREQYWQQFKISDREVGLSPSLVYSEILGVIKGYSKVIGCSAGYLNRDQYVLGTVAHKVSAHLDVDVKDRIYSMFEDYKRLKAARFEVDQADRSYHIGEFLTEEVSEPQSELGKRLSSIDFLYVDEVQDNLMSDIYLLRELCKSVDNTYWGGDTAQTILAGSAFRIKDLGSYLYNEVHDDLRDSWRRLPSNLAPSKFELTVNYRSHEGIVQCAASVVDSLYNLFPESLDQLARETAYDKSTEYLPVVLTDVGSEVSAFETFLLNSTSSLGAQQAILVRSEELAERLESRISGFCPILTITKSKGLEFDDILLYNFFTESESPEAWDFVHGGSMKTHRNARDSIPPLSLCIDLKLLYVAITRARQRCWIWDHGYVIDAMNAFWQAQGLVTTMSISEMITWGNASDSAQWIQKGQEYFANGMYKLAAGCFRRAGDEANTSHRIAMAYYDMSRAKLEMLRNDTEASMMKLYIAATELGNCATLVQGQSARHLWFHQAICLELAHKILESARAFVNAGLHERAVRTLLDSNNVKQGAKILRDHGHHLELRIKEEFLDRCRRHFFETREYEELPPLFNNNLDEVFTFARRNAFWEQLEQLLERHKRFDELARVHLDKRALIKGLDWFLKAFNHHHKTASLNEAASVTIGYAEWIFTLESKRSRPVLEQFEAMMQKTLVHEAELNPDRRKALILFRNVKNERLTPNMLKDWNPKHPEERLMRALILHNLLHDMSWLNSRPALNTVLPRLNAWASYNTILSKIIEAPEPSKQAAARRLFGFKPSGSEIYTSSNYVVAEGSLIAQCAPRYSFTKQLNTHRELLVPALWIDKIVKDESRRYLNDKLRKIYSGLNLTGWTTLYEFKPSVRPIDSPRPVSRAATSDRGFRDRLGMTAVALEAFAPVCRVPFETVSSHVNPSLLQLWVRRLFDVIYPITGIFEEFTPTRTRRGQPSYLGARACIRQFLIETSSEDLLSFVVANSLARQLELRAPNIESALHPTSDATIVSPSSEKLMIDALYNWEIVDGLTTVNEGMRNFLKSFEGPLDAVVLVHLVEAITCELIFHTRAAHSVFQDGFSDIILPYSWARSLAKRYAESQIVRDASSLKVLLEVITMVSVGLKGGANCEPYS